MDGQQMADNLLHAILKLNRYAFARDRDVEREPRTLTLTDDEAEAILFALDIYRQQEEPHGD